MADEVKSVTEEKVAENKKPDAVSGIDDELRNILDAAFKKLDAACMKMDEWDKSKEEEKKKADAEEKEKEEKEMADKAKKDAMKEDPEDTEAMKVAADKKRKDEAEEKEKMDAARADAVTFLQKQLADQAVKYEELAKLVRQPIADTDRAALAEAQSKADSLMMSLGEGRAPQPLVGEGVENYRRRLAAKLQVNSDDWSKIKLDSLQAEAFDIAERKIYADSAAAARKPSNIKSGYMREVRKQTDTGHLITEFYGNDDTHFVKQFTRPARRVRNIAYDRP